MKTIETKVKFAHDDTVYTIKQTKIEIPCCVCEKKGTILYNSRNIKCPECSGKGRFISNKKAYSVCEDPFVISRIKFSIGSNGQTSIKYKGRSGFSVLNRSEENLFFTKGAAQLKCDELNRVQVDIDLTDVIIPESFKETQPSIEKIKDKLKYFSDNNKFDKPVTINQDNVLQDGYINYLLCGLLNISNLTAIVEDKGII